MTRRARLSKYSRRTSSGGRRGGKAVIIIFAVIAFLLLSLTVSVAVGLALGNRAQEYEDSLPPLDISVKDRYSGDKTVKAVKAGSLELGLDASYNVSIGITDLSVCLRDADGFVKYKSAVAVSFEGNDRTGSRNLADEINKIHTSGGYVCAYIYSTAFKEQDEYLREIKKTYEIALIHEAAESGADDILLVGLDISESNLGEIEDFVSRAAISAGESALGVLLDSEKFENYASGVKRVSAVCDYVAVDLRRLPSNAAVAEDGEETPLLYKTLDELKYFIKVYSARVVFGAGNSKLAESAAKWGVTDYQIVE